MRTVDARHERAVEIAESAIYRGAASPGPPGGADLMVGVLTPPAYAVGHPGYRAYAYAEWLIDADPGATLRVRVRWLQIATSRLRGSRPAVREAITAPGASTALLDVEERSEFVPREVAADVLISDLLVARRPQPPVIGGGWSRGWLPHLSAARPDPWEPAHPDAGRRPVDTMRLRAPSGRRVRMVERADAPPTGVVWDTWSAQAELRLSAGPAVAQGRLIRLRAALVNTSGWNPRLDEYLQGSPLDSEGDGPRERALRHALVGAHVIVSTDQGAFVSLTDPPGWAVETARACRNDGLWPVVIDAAGGRTTVLLSPVRLADDPAAALAGSSAPG
ncbi:hypothetical protein [Frankia sp. AgKG'84/4]|uniref:hypothetical protein n=1 Tax=Frankia sp. AgKG'84/4 TaxID=573490 RepID=UPI00200C3BC3|nr:hypothetical protein [Frankia sp. AgKG'84/4]MCL9794437.1 hypothetical protein [Frankia sp. AgKG'84/4]